MVFGIHLTFQKMRVKLKLSVQFLPVAKNLFLPGPWQKIVVSTFYWQKSSKIGKNLQCCLQFKTDFAVLFSEYLLSTILTLCRQCHQFVRDGNKGSVKHRNN